MDLELRGKIAIVSGASRGIGRAIALALAREGAAVALVARGESALAALASEIAAAGGQSVVIATDVTAPNAGDVIRERTEATLGAAEILVSNVGGNRRGAFVQTTDDDWEAVLDLNLRCHVRLARAVAAGMAERRRGAILFVSSIFGREAGGPNLSIYNATKSALISLAKILALELAPAGVRVNSIAPGSIRFPGGSWDKRAIEDPEGIARFLADNIPCGRFGTAEEVADVAAFLVSARAGWITGASVNVDGGQSKSLI